MLYSFYFNNIKYFLRWARNYYEINLIYKKKEGYKTNLWNYKHIYEIYKVILFFTKKIQINSIQEQIKYTTSYFSHNKSTNRYYGHLLQ